MLRIARNDGATRRGWPGLRRAEGASAPQAGQVRPWQALNCCRSEIRSRRTGKSRLQLRNREIGRPSLDIDTLLAMFAQPSGSMTRRMRNIITKLLIVVVPWRAAGDG